ncbi:hypothetical protein PanWU01x14_067970 [Parasponia andersonii]|uniref:Transmembrane protein n=1 Tax=Parasponia andersonii TaxID=3476 RepID=A0A2P5DF71_PARAD|nr:hypothetical protein PanWU01x14_067970 [Parasponia andersonii]
MAEESSEQQLVSYKKLHKGFGFILTMMSPFIGIKYQGSLNKLIEEHNVTFHLFLANLIVYTVGILMVALESPAPNNIPLFKYIFLVCGIIAIELILFILVTHLGWFLAISAFGFLFYNHGYWVLPKLHDLFQQALTRFRLNPRTTQQEEGRAGDVPLRGLCNLFHFLGREVSYWFNIRQFLATFSSAAVVAVIEEPHEAGDGVQISDLV